MTAQRVNCEIEVLEEKGICPSGHKTRYLIKVPGHGRVCAFCLAWGNVDCWFGIRRRSK